MPKLKGLENIDTSPAHQQRYIPCVSIKRQQRDFIRSGRGREVGGNGISQRSFGSHAVSVIFICTST